MKKKIFYSIIVLALIIGSAGGGYWYGQNSRPSIEKIAGLQNLQQGQPSSVDFSLFWDVWAKVQEKFVNRSDIDYQKMVYGAISGMLTGLNDPYTVFMTPQENKDFSQSLQGNFEGIGAELGLRNNILTVISPLDDSPAKRAGLMPGDKILKIDDKITTDISVEEAVALIRGDKGTRVSLMILRNGWDAAKEFKITRDTISVSIVKLEVKDVNGKKIAHLTISQFTENSAAEFTKSAQQILSQKIDGIILDLRGNPGGYVDSAVDIASWFLPKNALVVTEDFGDGTKNEQKSNGINKLGDYKTVVLMDQGSASASEILAGALRDDKGIQLVGQKSFGKGSVQQIEQMPGGTSLKVTIAKWLTPSGHSIMDSGLEPDVKVEYTQEDADNNRDPQLDAALNLFK